VRLGILAALEGKRLAGQAILGAGAGGGISAKFIEQGGVDLLFVYNSGRFRMAGISSWAGHLCFGDANQIVLEMGEREILPIVKRTPVIAGVCGIDPTRRMEPFLQRVAGTGFAGIINYPTVTVIDGRMRRDLEAGGMGFDKEVELMTIAGAFDLLTTAYVCTEDEAKAMVRAGVDIVIVHLGLTAGGSVGATHAIEIDEAGQAVQSILEASKSVRSNVIVLAHGGPIATPDDAARLFTICDAEGFVGASSMERLPIETPLRDNAEAFASLSTRKRSTVG
jgi:predicted TIM-barrel enzyme